MLINVSSHALHEVSNHRKIDRSLNNLFSLTQKKTQKLFIIGHLRGECTDDLWKSLTYTCVNSMRTKLNLCGFTCQTSYKNPVINQSGRMSPILCKLVLNRWVNYVDPGGVTLWSWEISMLVVVPRTRHVGIIRHNVTTDTQSHSSCDNSNDITT